jgi:hypothetical protein
VLSVLMAKPLLRTVKSVGGDGRREEQTGVEI